jgi:diguanylate cyclase (GGDEF)-like protein
MSRTRIAPRSAAASLAAEADTDQDLIGWSLDTRLGREEPLSPSAMRQVLAAALGVDEAALAAFTPRALQTAMRRLRKLLAQFERLEEVAARDDLTGALRRGSGMISLQREIDRALRLGTRGIVVAFMDVDGLKRINDTRGHAAGDELLRTVVAVIHERTRSYDFVFRYGGDEFVCALLDVSLEQAQRTFDVIAANFALRSGGSTLTTGLAAFAPGDNAVRLVSRADDALYQERAKRRSPAVDEAATGLEAATG